MSGFLNIIIALFVSIIGGIAFVWLIFGLLLWIHPSVINGLKADPVWQFFLSIFFGIIVSFFLFVFSYKKSKKIFNN